MDGEKIGKAECLFRVQPGQISGTFFDGIGRSPMTGQGADLLEKRDWDHRPDAVSFASYSASMSRVDSPRA